MCAELRERGRLARCVERLSAALLLPDPRQVGPVRAVLCESSSLDDRDVTVLRWWRAVAGGPAVALLHPAGRDVPAGPWDLVMRRPVTVGATADALERLVLDGAPRLPDVYPAAHIALRLGPPWPAAWCSRCGRSRHGQPPENAWDRALTHTALVQFALEHDHPGVSAAR